jgi:hypothetical protein
VTNITTRITPHNTQQLLGFAVLQGTRIIRINPAGEITFEPPKYLRQLNTARKHGGRVIRTIKNLTHGPRKPTPKKHQYIRNHTPPLTLTLPHLFNQDTIRQHIGSKVQQIRFNTTQGTLTLILRKPRVAGVKNPPDEAVTFYCGNSKIYLWSI